MSFTPVDFDPFQRSSGFTPVDFNPFESEEERKRKEALREQERNAQERPQAEPLVGTMEGMMPTPQPEVEEGGITSTAAFQQMVREREQPRTTPSFPQGVRPLEMPKREPLIPEYQPFARPDATALLEEERRRQRAIEEFKKPPPPSARQLYTEGPFAEFEVTPEEAQIAAAAEGDYWAFRKKLPPESVARGLPFSESEMGLLATKAMAEREIFDRELEKMNALSKEALQFAAPRREIQKKALEEARDKAGEILAVSIDSDKLFDDYLTNRQVFAEENPNISSFTSGVATMMQGVANAPGAFVDAFAKTYINPNLVNAGLDPLPKVQTAFGTEYLNKAAQEYMPKVGQQDMETAIQRKQFGEWLISKLAANSPQIALSLASAYVAPLRAAVLPLLGATATGQSFAEGDESRVAVAKGVIEYLSEKIPLKVFDDVNSSLKGMSVPRQNVILAVAGQRLLKAGVPLTANAITGTIEETVNQLGGNFLDIYFQGKDIPLTKDLDEAAVLGAVTGKAFSIPQIAAVVSGRYEPASVLSRSLEGTDLAPAQISSVGGVAAEQARTEALRAWQTQGLAPSARTMEQVRDEVQAAQDVDSAITTAEQAVSEVPTRAQIAAVEPAPTAAVEPTVAARPEAVTEEPTTEQLLQQIRTSIAGEPVAAPEVTAAPRIEAPPTGRVEAPRIEVPPTGRVEAAAPMTMEEFAASFPVTPLAAEAAPRATVESVKTIKKAELEAMPSVDLSRMMGEMRETKPRTVAQMFGKNPTPEQVKTQQAKISAWNNQYSRVSRAQKIAQERDNAAFRAVQARPAEVAAPAEMAQEVLAGKEIRPPTDDVYEVAQANFNYPRMIGNQNVPIEDLKGGIPEQRRELERVDRLAAQIASDKGFFSRIIVDQNNNVIEGQHRLEAMRKLGAKTVPVYKIEDMGETFPVARMEAAILEAQPMRDEQATQIVQRALDAIAETGSVQEAAKLVIPRYQKAYLAALKAIESVAPAAQAPTFEDAVAPKATKKFQQGQVVTFTSEKQAAAYAKAQKLEGYTPREVDGVWRLSRRPQGEITVGLSAATPSILGISELYKSANAGDELAHTTLQLVAEENIKHLLSRTNAKVITNATTGLYGGAIEPSLTMSVTFDEADRASVLAALAKFASNFNQEQIHVRVGSNEDIGFTYDDGSYVTPVYRLSLESPLSRKEIENVIEQSGLYGLTFSDSTIEAYFVGDPSNEGEVNQFKESIRRAEKLLEGKYSGIEENTERLWTYGDGERGLGFDTIQGDVPAGEGISNETARKIAAYLNAEVDVATGRRKFGPVRTFEQQDISPQQEALQTRIAEAYDAMPVNDLDNPNVRRAYEELANEVLRQYKAIPTKVEVYSGKAEPYKSSEEMRRDLLDNNHLFIYATTPETFGPPGQDFADHPLLKDSGLKDQNGYRLLFNDLLRAVHDYYAHSMSPVQFGPKGEEAAWRNHMAMTRSPWARWALTAETRGQNSWVNFRPDLDRTTQAKDRPFAEQKAALLPLEFSLIGDNEVDAPVTRLIETIGEEASMGSLGRQPLGEERAIQEPSAAEVPVREGARGGEAVGERDAQRQEAAREGRAREEGAEEVAFRESDYRPSVVNWAKKEFGDRVAPNGNPVWENFTRWFGDSQVVNEKGEPLVVYHHTPENFDVFAPGGNDPEQSGIAIWATPNDNALTAPFAHQLYRALRQGRAFDKKGNTISANAVKMLESGELSQKQSAAIRRRVDEAIDSVRVSGINTMPLYFKISNPKIYSDKDAAKITLMYPEDVAKLKADGFDGAMSYVDGKLQEVVSFEPNQQKSSVGNNGNFSTEPSIVADLDRSYISQTAYVGYEAPEKFPQPSRRLNGLLNRLEDGKISEGAFIYQVRQLSNEMNAATRAKADVVRERERGADIVMEKLIAARRRGELPPETVEFGLWLLRQNPGIASELGISIKTPKDASIEAGLYNPAAKIMSIFKMSSNVGTAVHEILHHSERMMSADVQSGIRAEWATAYSKTLAKATGNERVALARMLDAMAGDAAAKREVTRAFADGTLSYDKHYQLVNPSEYWAVNATRILRRRYEANSWIAKAKNWLIELVERAKGAFGMRSDAYIIKGLNDVISGKAKTPTGKMLADINEFSDIKNQKTNAINLNYVGVKEWQINRLRNYQDRFIDLGDYVDEYHKMTGTPIPDEFNPRKLENLFSSKVAILTKEFRETKTFPIFAKMAELGVTKDEIEDYLYARHAPEYNREMEKRNPTQEQIDKKVAELTAEIDSIEVTQAEMKQVPEPENVVRLNKLKRDRQAWREVKPFEGTEEQRLMLSGMSDQQAQDYMDSLSPEKKGALEEIAAQWDGLVKIAENNTKGKTDDPSIFNPSFEFYVPFRREGFDEQVGGIPQGFSVKGKFTKAATGSLRPVTDILENIIAQAEASIYRLEANKIAQAMLGLAITSPNPDFWTVDQTPKKATLDMRTGAVVMRADPQYRNNPLVVVAKVPDGKGNVVERMITFNKDNPKAVLMAAALKNLDIDPVTGWLKVLAAGTTRHIAVVNTQYNPFFGITNLWRDLKGAFIQTANTPLAGSGTKIVADGIWMIPEIMALNYAEKFGRTINTKNAELYKEFRREGGQTFRLRDMWQMPEKRRALLEKQIRLAAASTPEKGARIMLNVVKGVTLDLLDAYNTTFENVIRLAAYKESQKRGLSKISSAELAKEATVNFDRRGIKTAQMQVHYAFFNSAIQGNVRIPKALGMKMERDGSISLSNAGKAIIAGGVLLGALQVALLQAFDIEEDDIKDEIKQKNFIIPLALLSGIDIPEDSWLNKLIDRKNGYLKSPMPLGYNFIVNLGRIPTEYVMGGFKNTSKHSANLLNSFLDSWNPFGSGSVWEMAAPTWADPVVALWRNKDWRGRSIYLDQMDPLDQRPGYLRAKHNASYAGTVIAYAINRTTGGTEFTSGLLSPTPDQIDYLIGVVVGGVGREVKVIDELIQRQKTGEATPADRLPLIRRFYGEVNDISSQTDAFYENIKLLKKHQAVIEGERDKEEKLRARGEPYSAKIKIMEYQIENPDSLALNKLDPNSFVRDMQNLNKEKREVIAKYKDSESPIDNLRMQNEVLKIDMQRLKLMSNFNYLMKAYKGE